MEGLESYSGSVCFSPSYGFLSLPLTMSEEREKREKSLHLRSFFTLSDGLEILSLMKDISS